MVASQIFAENHILKKQINEFDPNQWFPRASEFSKGDTIGDLEIQIILHGKFKDFPAREVSA